MMFRWEADMERFMLDASENSDHHVRLADAVARMIPNAADKHICDAGCGLGHLARALSPYVRHVTAIDASDTAAAAARTVAGGLSNVTVAHADLETYAPDVPFDAAVFCLFGRMDEILRIARRIVNGRVVVVRRSWMHHRFSVMDCPLSSNPLMETEEVLTRLSVPFTAQTLDTEFGQPFRSEADAVRFFQMYSRDAYPERITFSDIAHRLIRRDDSTFPWYLPEQKRLGIVAFDAKDIPETVL